MFPSFYLGPLNEQLNSEIFVRAVYFNHLFFFFCWQEDDISEYKKKCTIQKYQREEVEEDGRGGRRGDRQPPHKYIKNSLDTASAPYSRRPQASRGASWAPGNEKSNQCYKAIINQLKINILKKEISEGEFSTFLQGMSHWLTFVELLVKNKCMSRWFFMMIMKMIDAYKNCLWGCWASLKYSIILIFHYVPKR